MNRYKMEEKVKELSELLQDLQTDVIGIYKNDMGNYIEVVVHEDKHSFSTLHIGSLLGVTTCLYGKTKENKFIAFPGNKTLAQMMNDPVKFHKWFNKNVPKDYK